MVIETERREIPQEPVIKMAGEVRVKDVQEILGPGETDWFRRELFLLDYPEIDVRFSWEVQDNGPLRLRSVSISGNELKKVDDCIAVVLDRDDGLVRFVDPVREEEFGNRVTETTLSTREKLAYWSDLRVDSVPAGSRAVYSIKAANLATERLKERRGRDKK